VARPIVGGLIVPNNLGKRRLPSTHGWFPKIRDLALPEGLGWASG
jgi:hypothetical protein